MSSEPRHVRAPANVATTDPLHCVYQANPKEVVA